MWYTINDIDRFVESTRVLVYSIFGEQNKNIEEIDLSINSLNEESLKEINNCLTQQESMTIAFEFIKPVQNKKNLFKISESRYVEFMESLNSRLVSNILVKLTKEGLLESAFDEESNDFVFWAKSDENKNDQGN